MIRPTIEMVCAPESPGPEWKCDGHDTNLNGEMSIFWTRPTGTWTETRFTKEGPPKYPGDWVYSHRSYGTGKRLVWKREFTAPRASVPPAEEH